LAAQNFFNQLNSSKFLRPKTSAYPIELGAKEKPFVLMPLKIIIV
jgi:hypothetical protein